MRHLVNAVAAVAIGATLSAPAEARRAPPSPVTQFCGDRYCGFVQPARQVAEAHHGSKHRRKAERRSADRKHVAAPAPAPAAAVTLDIIAVARSYIGTNPTGWSHVWCARFMNMVVAQAGYRGTGSNLAADFARWGHRLAGPAVGAIAVMHRRGGGHVGVVTAVRGDTVIVVSGNTWDRDRRRRVMEHPYPRRSVYAYVAP